LVSMAARARRNTGRSIMLFSPDSHSALHPTFFSLGDSRSPPGRESRFCLPSLVLPGGEAQCFHPSSRPSLPRRRDGLGSLIRSYAVLPSSSYLPSLSLDFQSLDSHSPPFLWLWSSSVPFPLFCSRLLGIDVPTKHLAFQHLPSRRSRN